METSNNKNNNDEDDKHQHQQITFLKSGQPKSICSQSKTIKIMSNIKGTRTGISMMVNTEIVFTQKKLSYEANTEFL